MGEPLTPVECEKVMLVRGRFALIWRCPWCGSRQETFTDPPEKGPIPGLPATCRKCGRSFRLGPPEGEYEGRRKR
ncbi:MAG: hypothetical protein L0216_14525 [Planctomycetales bacterium]|nr:hypothetical protein [Planctomycetales bacterium]